jgi:hypothetical protein
MEEKIGFNNLSNFLKWSVILSFIFNAITLTGYSIAFIMGFIEGIIG